MEEEEIEKKKLVDQLLGMADFREEAVDKKRATGTSKEVLKVISEKILQELKNTHLN